MNTCSRIAKIIVTLTPKKRKREEEDGQGLIINILKCQKTEEIEDGEKKSAEMEDIRNPEEDECPYNSNNFDMHPLCIPLLGEF